MLARSFLTFYDTVVTVEASFDAQKQKFGTQISTQKNAPKMGKIMKGKLKQFGRLYTTTIHSARVSRDYVIRFSVNCHLHWNIVL